MSHYRDLYERAFAAVSLAADGVGAQPGGRGFRTIRRNRATFMSHPDMEVPAVVVAPDEGFRERVAAVLYDRHVKLAYVVYVGFLVDDRGPADNEGCWRISDAREAVESALWRPGALGGGDFDVEYDPAGEGADPATPPQTRGSWQKFVFTAGFRRAAGPFEEGIIRAEPG